MEQKRVCMPVPPEACLLKNDYNVKNFLKIYKNACADGESVPEPGLFPALFRFREDR
jgi:hypothetical protein|nr:MAG TPA: hypothetical protein [Bacteriophage sp.]DAZ64267.1 MAG TPA: hypothetical protein [Caudoviricetes sp.]